MLKQDERTGNVDLHACGHWVWNDEMQRLEFVSGSNPKVEGSLKKRRETGVSFSDLHKRPEGLAQFATLYGRGRQSIRKTLSPSHLNAYRSSLMQRQGVHVTTDDVKQVAVSLLQENYSLPIPSCFMAVLKSKKLDELTAALLLYLSCYFELKSLENKPKPLMAEPSMTERQMMAKTSAKVEMAQKKLAVCYFSLVMGPEMALHQNKSGHKSWVSSTYKELLLHECLYRFICYVGWVTFGRKHLRVIQEEVGRLLHSDTFNSAPRNRTDRNSGETRPTHDGSVDTGQTDPKERGCKGKSQRRPGLSSIVTQRSPLMVSLLPLPKEQSPHLFLGIKARRQSPPPAELCDTNTLMEELDQQLASVSFGILGQPLKQFSCTTLLPKGRKKKDGNVEDDEDEADEDEDDDAEDNNNEHSCIRVQGSKSSLMRCKSTGVDRHGKTSRTNTGISRATTEAVTSDTE
ncbi:protein phosphatase 1 regulatory subunit 36 [Myripristis murdjan]|uniref:protein phosphatase 1 regulatory subunit 36 n=1 Tax=Myripristis murdjan TaxID=586833 RepID=UPI001175D25A|nr:protein phosphatase 1 regulatory subunit 36 [Myripristis murdjan]